jgi:hypothetical protein
MAIRKTGSGDGRVTEPDDAVRERLTHRDPEGVQHTAGIDPQPPVPDWTPSDEDGLADESGQE